MSTSQPGKEGRILGLPRSRRQLVAVEEWIPPSQSEVEKMPPMRAYPSRGWRQALAARQQRDEGEKRLRAEAERAQRAQQEEERRRAGESEEEAREKRIQRKKMGLGDEPDAAPMPEEEDKSGDPAPEESAPAPPPKGPVLPEDDAEPAGGGGRGGVSFRPETPHDKLLGACQQMVRERPEDAAKLARTMMVETDDAPAEDGVEDKAEALPIMTKLAVIFVALGQETTGEVMKFLNDYEIEEITQAVATLKNVTVEMQDQVLEEFKQHLMAGEWVSQGGMDFARGSLERAVGPRKAQEILDRVASSVSSGFYMLKNVAPEQVAPFISHEHPQTIALILSQLDPAQASGILAQLPERMQADVAYRIATMENITPAVLKEIEEALEASLRDVLGGNQDVGGPKVVADILNLTGSSVEKNVLDQMDAQDPEVAEAVRNLMFVFADIAKLTDRELQILLREVDQKDLVIALKASSDRLKDKILGNMSEQVRISITEQMEFLGPMRLSEVEEVQLRIVQEVRQLEEQGQVTIIRGDSEDQFV